MNAGASRRQILFRINLIFIAAALFVELSAACLSTQLVRAKPTPTAMPPRAIASSSLSLHEIWRESLQMRLGFGSASNPSTRTLVVTSKAVYVVEYDPSPSAPLAPWRVAALDTRTGTLLWTTQPLELVDDMAVSASLLFVASSSGVHAYDVTTGHQTWVSNQPPPEHQAYSLFFDESQLKLIVIGGRGNLFSVISSESGTVGDLIESKDGVVMFDSQYRYKWSGREFWLADISTDIAKWTLPLASTVPPWPIIKREEDILVLPSVTSRAGWHSVTVVDRASGKTKWQCSDCYASDVAVDSGTLYAISRDGSLAAYDLKTGQLRGTVQFAGGRVMEPLNTQYSVAAANGFVFLYFGDSHELIAFGPGQ